MLLLFLLLIRFVADVGGVFARLKHSQQRGVPPPKFRQTPPTARYKGTTDRCFSPARLQPSFFLSLLLCRSVALEESKV